MYIKKRKLATTVLIINLLLIFKVSQDIVFSEKITLGSKTKG